MANGALDNRSQIDEVRRSLPDSHHFLVDLEPSGLTNDNQVSYAADRPHGMIEGADHRPGTESYRRARSRANKTTEKK